MMPRIYGLAKEEMLKIAREAAPSYLQVDIEQNDRGSVLILRDGVCETRILISGAIYDGPKDERLDRKIAEEIRAEIIDNIKQFGITKVERVIQDYSLDDYYKEKHADKNVLYKVSRWYTQGSERATYVENFGLYYKRRVSEVIRTFDPLARLFAVGKVKHDRAEEIMEMLFSMMWRFEQLLFAYDRIADMTKTVKHDNDALFVVRFHLYYFISLVRTLGDNLAWLLKLYLNLNLDKRETDLLVGSFQTSLQNTSFYPIIYGGSRYSEYKKIKDYRDIIEHRHALHLVHVKIRIDGKERIMIPRDPEDLVPEGLRTKRKEEKGLAKELAKVRDEESIAEYGPHEVILYVGLQDDLPFDDPVDFCKRRMDFISDVCTKVFDRMIMELTDKKS